MLNETRFFLLLDPRKDAAELMAECALCGAITTQPLEAAWAVGCVMCPECGVQAKLDVATLDALGRQAVGAQSMIVRLLAKPGPR